MVTAKQIINSTKSNITKAPQGQTQKGSAGYDNIRDDIEKVKKLREGSIEKVPVNDNDIANKKYVDDNSGGTTWEVATAAKFDITANTSVVSATADVKIKVLAFSIHNNDSDGTDDEHVRIQDGNGGTDLYGGATGHIYLPGRGGVFVLPMSPVPYFTCSTNTALYINPANGKRVSGVVWYIKEA